MAANSVCRARLFLGLQRRDDGLRHRDELFLLLDVGKPAPLVHVAQLVHATRHLLLQRAQGRNGFTGLLRRLTPAHFLEGGGDVAQQSFAFAQGDGFRLGRALGAGGQPRELREPDPVWLSRPAARSAAARASNASETTARRSTKSETGRDASSSVATSARASRDSDPPTGGGCLVSLTAQSFRLDDESVERGCGSPGVSAPNARRLRQALHGLREARRQLIRFRFITDERREPSPLRFDREPVVRGCRRLRSFRRAGRAPRGSRELRRVDVPLHARLRFRFDAASSAHEQRRLPRQIAARPPRQCPPARPRPHSCAQGPPRCDRDPRCSSDSRRRHTATPLASAARSSATRRAFSASSIACSIVFARRATAFCCVRASMVLRSATSEPGAGPTFTTRSNAASATSRCSLFSTVESSSSAETRRAAAASAVLSTFA